MAKTPGRPEEDPAEGSREVIDRELAQQDGKEQAKSGQAQQQGGSKKLGSGQQSPIR